MNLIGGVGPHDAKMTRKPVREAIGVSFATIGAKLMTKGAVGVDLDVSRFQLLQFYP